MKKTFVLDTSVLIHDPNCIFNFSDNHVVVPVEVIQELDRIKTESSERGRIARTVQRKLLSNFGERNLTESSRLPNGGSIQLVVSPSNISGNGNGNVKKIVGDMQQADHRIIACAEWLAKEARVIGGEVYLVTKDMGMMLKGRVVGVMCQDYEHDKTPEATDDTVSRIELNQSEAQGFLSEGTITLTKERCPVLPINAYGLFTGAKRIPWRHVGGHQFVPVNGGGGIQIPNGMHIKAKNLEQLFLLDALINPDIHLVTAVGAAGTGKTIVSVAAALWLIGKRKYTGLCIARPNQSIGKENGFLPGSIEEKMKPWLQPYADALNFLHRKTVYKQPQSKRKAAINNSLPRKPYDELTESGLVEVTALEYIRGRSIPNRLFICDEVQNAQPLMIKTITSRMAEGSKLVYLGDLEQIDNPYLDAYSNGLAHVRTHMRDLPNVAHLTLTKCERSILADQAAKLL